jgi:hypothetical protein
MKLRRLIMYDLTEKEKREIEIDEWLQDKWEGNI